jgi:hypothetical protein
VARHGTGLLSRCHRVADYGELSYIDLTPTVNYAYVSGEDFLASAVSGSA